MKTRLLIIFLCFWSIWSVYAQQYPVDCRISVLPPYSTRFYDYASSVQRFKVSLLLRDFSKSNLDVVLQIRLKGPGFVIENPSDYFSSDAYNLIPGRTLTLSGMDLSSNFNPSNLETYGVELSEMFSGVGLPPGPYEWEVRAFERFRDRQVSNTAVFRMNLSLNYPPLLRQPANGSVLSVQTPQNLRFSWMPRASASPSQGTLYTLFLYEVPEGDDAEAVVNSGSAPYRMIETTQSFYQYGGGEIPLEVGKRYAWQVQVSDIYGVSSYVNNGYSEVFSFVYGKNSCSVPSNVISKVASDGAVELSWEAVSDAQSYILRYRVAGESKYESITTDTPNYLLLYQAAGKKYEYQVSATCQQSGSSAFTPWQEFEIADSDEAEAADSTAYISDPGLSYEAEVYEPDSSQLTPPKPEDPSLDDLLNSPIKLYVGGEDGESPLSLPTNPSSLSTEELKAALKMKKPTCAGITASYSCGNHDVVPQYSGSIVSVNTGDEIAMNSLIMSVVSIDASGNGSGKIKIPMFNNAEVGVTLSGIKVAEGGCIVEGRAELSGVDLALLNAQQRAKLDQAYSLFLQATDAVSENINNLQDFIVKAKDFTKNYKGSKAAGNKAKAYHDYAEKIEKQLLQSTSIPDSLKHKLSASIEASKPAWEFFKSGQSCTATGSNGGGNGYFSLPLADCAAYSRLIDEHLAELEDLVYKKVKLNENGSCFSISTMISSLRVVPLLNSSNLWLYDLPDGCVSTTEDDVQANSSTNTTNLGKVSLSLSGSFKGEGIKLTKVMVAELDKSEPKRVNVLLDNVAVMVFTFEDAVKANKMLEWANSNVSQSTKITIYRDKVSEDFLAKVETICSDLEIDPNYLMACMAFETGETFSPCVKNPGSSATGLIQFMSSTAISLGTTTEALCKMTAVEQLDYVKKYFQPYKGKIKTIADIYMVIFCPKGVGKEMNYTLYPPRQIDYDRNKGLDKDKNTIITKQEAYNAVKGKLEKELK